MDDGARTRVRALGVWAVALTLFAAVPVGLSAPGNGNEKEHCNAGRGNGAEGMPSGVTADGLYRNDCDPGNSAAHNMGGDHAYTPTG